MAADDLRLRARRELEQIGLSVESASYLVHDRPPAGWESLVTHDQLRAELSEVRTELGEVRVEIAQLASELRKEMRDQTRWLTGALLVALTLATATSTAIATAIARLG
jgi:hypothetical protein